MMRGDEMRLKNLILILVALTTVVLLAACASSGQSGGGQGDQGNAQKPSHKNEQKQPHKNAQKPPDKPVAPEKGKQKSEEVPTVDPPSKDMFKLTIPQMAHIKNDEIPTGPGTDETLFHDYAAVHLKGTGFPWDKEANVYIAGHRLGFPGTASNLAFDDLNVLKNGDEFYIVDSDGRKYTYKVFSKFIANPENLAPLQPIDGKNVVTLQTCTKPDYVKRFLVRGELVKIEKP
jgi:sortase A